MHWNDKSSELDIGCVLQSVSTQARAILGRKEPRGTRCRGRYRDKPKTYIREREKLRPILARLGVGAPVRRIIGTLYTRAEDGGCNM